ncbi:hypothetical protein VC83_05928 [Pseudogymnoascus destructans]|uniref:Ig-like domain-containing protein n=2 Tax=Pseudogymnoascus destructans TaxID=655981 RepID=L8G0W4_PSED2|nr:uncharacterized protein VC83_05928 [Pseudogymnoascus destructans]ELR06920.1 hypothetical protein GMDG_02290 [Pseudogymnoascus destructans 20631-21]OAF57050.1 hypothetical protein VC83_05928 [Pseudogymnoascus destructans]
MMFPALWLAFIACTAASVLRKQINAIPIAYRTVGADQAAKYQSKGTIQWEVPTVRQLGSSDQLGQGVYLSPVLGDWPGEANGYFCAILADSTAWNNINKVYMPKETTDESPKPLWFTQGVPNRPAFLMTVGGRGYTTANTVLISPIYGSEEKTQFLIPPALLSSSNPLSISVQCAAKSNGPAWQALQAAYGTINWRNWQGLKGPVP